ncbi:hypothetical protein GQ44DRAFT_464624 [Phaeosphaeriaceae sp. PMI808]|nr:hypothetical protein GQ44DRAFT_464624 [Phaeosphaeriaceae sp. PMI808]
MCRSFVIYPSRHEPIFVLACLLAADQHVTTPIQCLGKCSNRMMVEQQIDAYSNVCVCISYSYDQHVTYISPHETAPLFESPWPARTIQSTRSQAAIRKGKKRRFIKECIAGHVQLLSRTMLASNADKLRIKTPFAEKKNKPCVESSRPLFQALLGVS